EVLYGSRQEVLLRAPDLVRQLASRRPGLGRRTIDTRSTDGLIVHDSSCRLARSGRHFHLFAPMMAVRSFGCRGRPLPAHVFDVLLEFEWGPLAVLDQSIRDVPFHDRRLATLFRSFLAHWPPCWAEGRRYATGASSPVNLWDAAFVLKYCLILRGVPAQELLSPPPGGNLRALLERHSDKFSDVLTSEAPALRASGT
ncbi:MAG TPA: hypothetical protein VKU41_22910, partial [Polyangiaceae bacterium]|nr:hypothetical protein [Polyangiaceae bacterium]